MARSALRVTSRWEVLWNSARGPTLLPSPPIPRPILRALSTATPWPKGDATDGGTKRLAHLHRLEGQHGKREPGLDDLVRRRHAAERSGGGAGGCAFDHDRGRRFGLRLDRHYV